MTNYSKFSVASLVLATFTLLSGCSEQPQAAGAAQQRPATAVNVIAISPQSIELTTQLPGRLSAFREAQVRPQVDGIIQKRLFTEGSMVEQGQVLYELDAARYLASLSSAKAQLQKAKAGLEKARLQIARYEGLVGQKAISQEEFDVAKATYQEAQAIVMAAEADLKQAQINVDYTKIKAPITGRVGRSNVTEGALVTANQSAELTIIQQLDPLYMDLSQAGEALIRLRQAEGSLAKVDNIEISLNDGSPVAQRGRLQFADANVDPSTGTVIVRAIVDNPEQVLLPGLFVRAKLPTTAVNNAILVPQRAVSRLPNGTALVMVVGENNVIEARPVTIANQINGQWLVQEGLNSGEQVVVEGLQKIRPGASVSPTVVSEVN